MKQLWKSVTAGLLSLLLLMQGVCPVAQAAQPEGRSGDEMVRLTQRWLNQEYGDVPGFGSVTVDGLVGWDTIYGLTRALQHELGIRDLYDNFGPQTEQRYSENPLRRKDGAKDRKFAILQGALWCKGYNPGYNIRESGSKVKFDAVFDADVEKAVLQVKRDMGFEDPTGIVTTRVMKALLSMDSFRLLSGGDSKVRSLQQMLNREYSQDLGVLPCDGVFNTGIDESMVYALQIEEGLGDEATGYFGQITSTYCPVIPYVRDGNAVQRYSGGCYSEAQIRRLTELAQHALRVEGYDCGTPDGVYGGKTEQALRNFQRDFGLPITGKVDQNTWKPLLTGQRDTTRRVKAADCFTKIDRAKAATLYDHGYRYIGRYLTLEPKAITRDEAEIIFDAGLRFFPIYQTSADEVSYFSASQGKEDGQAAIAAANKLGLPDDTILYFAVDCDLVNSEITDRGLPYFKAVYNEVKDSHYRVGVYGSRNVCSRVSKAGYAVSSFVADMSPGYNGNMGYPLPDNWAFDQLATVTIGSGQGQIEIDKNDYSGRDSGVSRLKMPIPELKVENRYSSGRPVLIWDAVPGAVEYQVYCRAGKNGSYRRLKTVSGTQLHHSSAEPGTTYYYKVRGVRSDGEAGRFSDVKYRTADCARPDVSVTLRSDGKPVLTWPKVKGAVGYRVERSTGNGYTYLATAQGTRLSNGSAKNGTRYTYRVQALCDNKYGNSAWSYEDSIRSGVPKAPAIHLSNKASSGKIYLTWDAVTDAEKYEVYCRQGESGSYHRIYSTASGQHLTHGSAQPGVSYSYQVRAVIGECKGDFSTAKHRTCDLARPDVSVRLRSDGKPVLTWAKIDGAAGYEVFRSVDGGDYTQLTTVSGTSLTNTSARSGVRYSYQVRALCSNTAANSARSEAVTIRAK